MNIGVIGSGYVGLVTAACLSEMGNKIFCFDKNLDKINSLNKGIIPIYEPGLSNLILENINKNNLSFHNNLFLKDLDVVFICVDTPISSDGSANTSNIIDVAKEIGKKIENNILIINKSTAPVGTLFQIKKVIDGSLNKRNKEIKINIASNPEFLKEGTAVSDFMKPDRIIIGANEKNVFDLLKKLYFPFVLNHDRIICMDITSAELTKYAANAMLATKISFINEISNISERLGADINKIRIGIGSDKRIGYDFLYPGNGYGGSCLPKDVSALLNMSNKFGYNANLIKAVKNVNDYQKNVVFKKILKRFKDLSKLKIAIWGLSFKPGTDDIREAPAVHLIKLLLEHKVSIKAYDPKAVNNVKSLFPQNKNIIFKNHKYDVLEDVDALVLMTEWKEFRSPDFSILKDKMNKSIIFDGRNQYQNFDFNSLKFEYYQIGVSE